MSTLNVQSVTEGILSDSPELIKFLGQSSLLDIKSSENNIVLNGLSLDSADQRYLLSIFTNQIPVPFNLKNLSFRQIGGVDELRHQQWKSIRRIAYKNLPRGNVERPWTHWNC